MPLTAVFFDSGPLSMAARRPGANAESDACQQWAKNLVRVGVQIYVPEIADYETRRELIRAGHRASVQRRTQSIALDDVIVASVNVRHISRFVQAAEWRKISSGMALPGVPVI